MLYENEKLDEENVLEIFHQSEVKQLNIMKLKNSGAERKKNRTLSYKFLLY